MALLTNDPSIILSVIRELSMRKGLSQALGGRTPEQLEGIMTFIISNIRKARYQSPLLELSNMVINLYSCASGISDKFDMQCKNLLKQVKNECNLMETIMRMQGTLGVIMSVGA